MRKKLFFGDAVIVLVLLAVCGLAMSTRFSPKTPSGAVRVTLDGKPYAVYPLDTQLDTFIGDTGVRLVITDGKAYIAESDCADKLCIRAGSIGQDDTGKSLVCLPNRVVVTTESDPFTSSESEVDGIVG